MATCEKHGIEKNGSGGHRAYKCEECHREYMRQWRVSNVDKVQASKKKRYENHREEDKAYTRAYYWKNREAVLSKRLKKKYGIAQEVYNELLKNQDGRCAICGSGETVLDYRTGQVRSLAVDHNHETDKVRGLLCVRCNTVIGRVGEDTSLLQAMIDYLVED